MENLSFEELPNAVTVLIKDFSELKRLIIEGQVNPQPSEQLEQLLTVQEAAKFLKLSTPTIYTKVSRGELPVMKQGKRLYFSSVELMAYIKEGRKKSNTEIEAEANAYLSNNKKGLSDEK